MRLLKWRHSLWIYIGCCLPMGDLARSVLKINLFGVSVKLIGMKTFVFFTVPSAPRELQSKGETNTSLTVSWNRPQYPNAPTLDYILSYRLSLWDDVFPFNVTIRAPADKESITFVIRNLLPYSYYTVRVNASSRAGIGLASDDVTLQTKVGGKTKKTSMCKYLKRSLDSTKFIITTCPCIFFLLITLYK